MKSQASPFIVAIASVSGGGKTTAVAGLTHVLPNTKALYFDQYDCVGPEDIMDWLDKGADINEWNLLPFMSDLGRLLAESLNYIILDFPFADQHAQSSPYIDFTVFIDTPLDLALARRLMRDSSDAGSDEILGDIKYYADRGRVAYLHMLETIRPNSDLVVDGTHSITEVVHSIAESIRNIQKPYS
ncbi:nucleoside/nucleotide kinase family protein [Planococcus salinarum]|uniref:hypothetical protein n=1 Tax=Planococcus salinarum TaxID=622695 RepID=UPI000E3C9EB8|nr:hypothetical protein [Planococcus salinarum]TAA72682.1 hypothetical protein D2909_04720 [Planococcus salinarum]